MGRHATVYDAVAERVGYQGFIHSAPGRDSDGEDETSKNRGKRKSKSPHRSRGQPVAPDEVLFRARKAPERYEEDDIYAADRHLGPGQTLPDSDLLKAIHAYTSDFYSMATGNKGAHDYHSMNETALIACGILLEEACKELLGSDGDLVFTEAEPNETPGHRSIQETSNRAVPPFLSARKNDEDRISASRPEEPRGPRDLSEDSTDETSSS